MKNIKKYKSFLESSDGKLWIGVQHEYSIYDWFEDLKRFQWNDTQKSKVNISSIKTWCNHFIGDGWFEKISNHVDSILNALKKADIDYINDRMYDVYDEFSQVKQKFTTFSVIYGDVERHDNTIRSKFNGVVPIKDPNSEDDKVRIIIHIIKDIVSPTLHIGGWKSSQSLRSTKDEIYVTDKKYQCQNFTIKNYIISSSDISEHLLKAKEKYNINFFLDMYQPAITISLGGFDTNPTGKFNLKEMETKIDEVLPPILNDLDYVEVIFDHNRHTRQFDDNADFEDYTLKILLKL